MASPAGYAASPARDTVASPKSWICDTTRKLRRNPDRGSYLYSYSPSPLLQLSSILGKTCNIVYYVMQKALSSSHLLEIEFSLNDEMLKMSA